MKTINMEDLRSYGPCYDPTKYLPENWTGTILDIMDIKDCPFEDRLWTCLRKELVSEKLMRLFAVWCARQVITPESDDRSINALVIAEKFANGEATEKELNAARSAARSAAWSTARSAVESAAWNAAWNAARSAARSAAWNAAWNAAWSTARSAQEIKFREMISAGVKTGDVY